MRTLLVILGIWLLINVLFVVLMIAAEAAVFRSLALAL